MAIQHFEKKNIFMRGQLILLTRFFFLSLDKH